MLFCKSPPTQTKTVRAKAEQKKPSVHLGKAMKKRKIKFRFRKIAAVLLPLLIGAACGAIISLSLIGRKEAGGDGGILSFALLLGGMYAGILIHLIIHEAGHLLFGLMTGYTFSSFRIGSIMLQRENGRMAVRRFSIAGTAGQCLMAPPDMKNGAIPVRLFNLGGSIMNLLASLVFLAAAVLLSDFWFVRTLFLLFALTGAALGLMNGIPMRLGLIENDGYNAVSVSKNPEAMRAFWLQLKVNDRQSRGDRLKDMPEAWFVMPSDESMKNTIVAAIGVLCANRLLDEGRFEEARARISELLTKQNGVSGLHRSLLVCDQAYIALTGQAAHTLPSEISAPSQKKVMKAMKNFPSVIRTEYALALLSEKNFEKAEKIKAQFEKIAVTYPYSGDIESERALMERASAAADSK